MRVRTGILALGVAFGLTGGGAAAQGIDRFSANLDCFGMNAARVVFRSLDGIADGAIRWEPPETVDAPPLAQLLPALPPGGETTVSATKFGEGEFVDVATGDVVETALVAPPSPRCDLQETLRLGGDTRFHTAAEVAMAYWMESRFVYLANGQSGAIDALMLTGVPEGERGPVLLVTRDGIPQPTRDALTALSPRFLRVLGGTAAVPPAVMAEAEAIVFGP